MIVCFTGHRKMLPHNVCEAVELLEKRIEELSALGEMEFRAGGAIGFDTIAALCVLTARESHKNIKLHLILPCRDQTRGWSDADVEKYNYILSHADKVSYSCEAYTPYCMHKRDRELVDGADLCIAYCGSDRGGTAYTVDYANKCGVKVENIYV